MQGGISSLPARRLVFACLAGTALLFAEALLAQGGVKVTLREVEPLQLVEFMYGQGKGEVGLDGVLEVSVENAGEKPVVLRDLHVHGLLFVNKATKEECLLIHPCDCFFVTGDAPLPPGLLKQQTHSLAPGETQRFTLEDFGCGGGMWKAPPPGEYLLYYRVLPAPAPPEAAEGKPSSRPPSAVLPECKKVLLSGAFWAGAPTSGPVSVTLKKPVKKHVPT